MVVSSMLLWASLTITLITLLQLGLPQRYGTLMVTTCLLYTVLIPWSAGIPSVYNCLVLILYCLSYSSSSMDQCAVSWMVLYKLQFTRMERFAFQFFIPRAMILMATSLRVSAGIQSIQYVLNLYLVLLLYIVYCALLKWKACGFSVLWFHLFSWRIVVLSGQIFRV